MLLFGRLFIWKHAIHPKRTWEKINKMAAAEDIIAICDKFHSSIAAIIRLVKDKQDCPELERLEKLISLCKAESDEFLIERCKEKLWDSRTQIKTKDDSYFMTENFDRYIKKGSQYADFQYQLMDLVREGYPRFTPPEKDKLWKFSNDMLKCACAYMLAKGDFDDK